MDERDWQSEEELAFAQALATRLKALREQRRLSQEQVAYSAGISTYAYQKLERGYSPEGKPINVKVFTLIGIARVFEVSLPELLTF